MKYFFPLLIFSIFLLNQSSVAQNAVLTTSAPLPGGGSGSDNVVIGKGNTYPSASALTA